MVMHFIKHMNYRSFILCCVGALGFGVGVTEVRAQRIDMQAYERTSESITFVLNKLGARAESKQRSQQAMLGSPEEEVDSWSVVTDQALSPSLVSMMRSNLNELGRPLKQWGEGEFLVRQTNEKEYRFGSCSAAYSSTKLLSPAAEARRRIIMPLLKDAACRHRVPVQLLDALVIQESGYKPFAKSRVGAFGLTQLMPGTAEDMGVNRYSIVSNLDGGAKYLAAQLRTFGRADFALAAYNAGPGRVKRAGGVPRITETIDYVSRVLKNWNILHSERAEGSHVVTDRYVDPTPSTLENMSPAVQRIYAMIETPRRAVVIPF